MIEENKQLEKREVNVSAVVPSWVDDILRRISFEERISRSEVVNNILIAALMGEDHGGEFDG